MAEVIGTAYVRIRAITAGLSGDIKDAVDKGVAEAHADQAGEKVGTTFAKGVDDVVPDEMGKIGKKGAKKLEQETGKGGDKAGTTLAKKLSKSFVTEWDKNSKNIGKNFTKFLNNIKIPKIGWAGLIGLPAAGGALKLVSNLVVGLVGQIGFIGTAVGGLGAALAGVGGALALAIGPLMLGLKAATPTLDAFKKSLNDLKKPFISIAETMQRNVFPALQRSLAALGKWVLSARPFFTVISKTAAGFIDFGTAILTSQKNTKNWLIIFKGAEDIFATLARVILRVVDILLPFLATVMPLAEDFAKSIEQTVIRWHDLIKAGSESGTLGKKLKEWYDRAKLLGRIFGNTFKILGNILQIGASVFAPTFGNADKTIKAWADWTSSPTGAGAIKQVFENALPVVKAVSGLISDVVKLLLTPVVKGDNKGILNFIALIRTEVLPTLAGLAQTLAPTMGDSLVKFVDAFAKFVDTAAKSGALTGFFTVITNVLDILTKILEIPGIGQWVGDMLKVVGVFAALNKVLLGFPAKAAGTATQFLTDLVKQRALSKIAAKGGEKAFANLGAAAAEDATGALGALAAAFSEIIIPILLVVAAIVGLILIIKNWSTVTKALNIAWEATVRFFKRLPDILKNFAKIAGAAITDFFKKLPGYIVTALGALGAALAKFAPVLFKWIADAVPKVLGALVRLELAILGWVAGLALKLLAAMPGLIVAFLKWTVDILPGLLAALANIAGHIVAWVLGLPILLAAGIIALGIVFTKWAVDILPTLLTNLAKIGTTILDWLANLPATLTNAFLDLTVAFGGWLTDFIIALPGYLSSIGTALFDWIVQTAKDLPGKFEDMIKAFASAGVKIGKAFIQGIIDGGEAILKTAAGWVGKALNIAGIHLGGGGGGGGSGNKNPSISMVMPGLAAGGIVTKPMLAAIAESGPEAVVPIDRLAKMIQSAVRPVGGAPAGPSVPQAAVPINLLVRIGERDITDIVDARVSDSDLAMSRSLFVRR